MQHSLSGIGQLALAQSRGPRTSLWVAGGLVIAAIGLYVIIRREAPERRDK
jgi:hypothetical protein